MFHYGLGDIQVARQVAKLINSYSGLVTKRNSADIMHPGTEYVIETHGNIVIAICGLSKVSSPLSELKHLVVRPEWRGRGVGLFMVSRALKLCQTPMVYATVKRNNHSSLTTLKKAGFTVSEEFSGITIPLILLLKVCSKWKKRTFKSNLFPENESTTLTQSIPDGFMELVE